MVMTLYQEFNDLLQALKFCDRNQQCYIIKKMASSIQFSTKEDLQGLLDFIITTHDMELQVKLFSIISVHLINNDTNIDLFVTFNSLYDAIDRILSKNLPRKTTVVLNFLTLLLQSDSIENYTWRKRSLYMHAQNQIKVSGCLASMADIFTSGMTYQDTWRALCRCLAETCNNSEPNQNYCTHLIPKCVIRCNQRNMETFQVLQNLIYNNKRNVKLFLECNGMMLFKRELLQYECSLQLLSTVVQTSTDATITAQNMSILQHVHDILRLCGPYTPTGQWATVILYYADTKIKGYDREQNIQNIVNKSRLTATKQNFQINDDVNDTMLFRNVIKNIVQWHTKEENMYNNIFLSNNIKNKRQQRDSICCNIDTEHSNEKLRSRTHTYNSMIDRTSIYPRRNKPVDELSFSFLRKHFKDTIPINKNKVTKNVYEITRNPTRTYNDSYVPINLTKSQIVTTQTTSQLDVSKFFKEYQNDISVLDLKLFKPNFVSTPKHRKNNIENKIKNLTNAFSVKSRKFNRIQKRKYHEEPRKKLSDKTLKQRIFNAINNSCTVLMNSVTSMFKPKNINQPVQDPNSKANNNDRDTCSYSFTEYMRKRDAVKLDDRTVHQNDDQHFSFEPDSCGSCNNTEDLKHKMLNDNFLKETVRKLKVGINMYGCDFEKISRSIWPHEAYMTPATLYNLYRKLIMK